jgi:hypothetical protein
MTRALHLIRKIRNVFAHETSGSTLNSGSHRDRVMELCRPALNEDGFIEFEERFFSNFEGASRNFRAVSALVILQLNYGLEELSTFTDKNKIGFLPSGLSSYVSSREKK